MKYSVIFFFMDCNKKVIFWVKKFVVIVFIYGFKIKIFFILNFVDILEVVDVINIIMDKYF